jgi:subtilisin family serine protease
MRSAPRSTTFVAVLAASLFIALSSQEALAGRLHPELEAQLKSLPPGGSLPVIVEMFAQADPVAAAHTAPHGQRRMRLQAVVDALRDVSTRRQAGIRAVLAREQALGTVRQVKPFWVFNGLAVTATEPVIRRLAARTDVWEIRPDSVIPPPPPIQPTATPGTGSSVNIWNLDLIRAPEVWALDPSYSGVGQVVGSFDTGVDLNHPDLQPRYRGNHAISWFDPYGEHATPFDPNGHGSHTTGTAVGGDASGVNIGVAPGARWIAAKAWNDGGIGLASAFHAIFEWFLAPGGNPANAPDVVNGSWGFAAAGCFNEFQADILAWRAAGIFPSFSAGNNGPSSGSVRSPGATPESFAVGATDALDGIAPFSARGPSPCGGALKPDVSAPGVEILSTVPGGYVSASGTSMAAPHVSGAVAVLRSINPALTVEELETLLTLGAVDLGLPGPDDTFGAGRLDLFQSARILVEGINVVTISATNAAVAESGQATPAFTLSRIGSTAEPLTIQLTATGTATPGSDYVALPPSVTIPAGAATTTLSVIPLDDALPESHETVVLTLTDDPAYIVGSPSRATATIVSDEPTPDLTVSTLTAPSVVALPSAALTVTDAVSNQGNLGADATTLRFYLSTDALLDAGDAALGSRVVPALATGGTSSASTTLTIPASTSAGPYYLIARADADDEAVETDESNNAKAVPIQVRVDVTVTPGTIDLAAPPATFTLVGSGFANVGFGLPVVNFVRDGAILAQARATAVTGTTTLTVPFPTPATSLTPNPPGLSVGAVDVQVYLQTSAGTFSQLGSGPLTVTDTRPAPGVETITPSTVDVAVPPPTFTITGTGFANVGYGLPVVNFVRNGSLLAQARATVLTGTTTLTVPFPTDATALARNLPGLSAGAVQAQVYSQTGGGSFALIGSVLLTVIDSRPGPGVDAITPSTVDLAAPPATFSIAGNGFANVGFGLPVVNFVRNGAILAQARATALAGTTTLTVPFPTAATALSSNLPGLSPGAVQAQVYTQTGGGSFALIGSVTLTVTDTRPAPGVDAITPNPVDLAAPPASFIVTGSGFANVGFGLPVVNFVRDGAILAQARATALTGTTTLTVPFPPAGLSPGTVQAQVYAQTSAASFTLIGSVALTITDTRPAPGVEAITPSTVDLAAPPATVSIAGNGFANLGFGLPVINFVRNGVLLAQARASALTGSTTLTVPFPTAGFSPGTVEAQVWSQTGPGSFALLGSVPLTITDTRPAPGVSAIAPSTIDLAAPPATFTITGNGFVNAGFGLPVVNFVRNGALVAQARATALTGTTTLTVPFPTAATALSPALPGLSPGTVQAQVWSQTSPGSFALIGSVTVTVTDTRPAPGVTAITPDTVDLAAPPATVTVTGNGFANVGFGLPVVNFVRNGAILAQARATALTGSTTLTVPLPTAGLSAGTVQAQVYAQGGPASFTLIGSVTLTVTDTRPAPGVSAITPDAVSLAAPPAAFTITGNGFANYGFGLPVVNFVRNGTVLAQARATGLGGTTTLTVPFPTAATALSPNLPGLSPGTVQAQVYAQTGFGSFSLIGTVSLTVESAP